MVKAFLATCMVMWGLAWQAGAAERLPFRVAVSIPPLQGLAQRLGGEELTVVSLMSENQDPHTFHPSPRVLAGVGDCSLFFTVGVDFEAVVSEKLARMFPDLRIVDVNKGLAKDPTGDTDHADHDGEKHEAAREGTAGHGHGHGHGHLHDPHVWLSVPHLMQMSAIMADALEETFPARRALIERHAAALQQELKTADANFGKRLAGCRGMTFYVYHPAFGYFAGDYGLVQKAVEVDGKAPSPRQLAHLVEQARRDDVSTIFVQPQFPRRSARILASRIGGRVISVNPLSRDSLAVLRQAVEALSARK